MDLWPHQERAIASAREAYRQGRRSIVIVMPTGAGKTRTMVSLLRGSVLKGNTCLWLAHRRELISQAADAIRRAGIVPGIIMPGEIPRESPIQVASVDTLKARGIYPEADVVVLDECHHAVADKNADILSHYKEKGRLLFGLTATPSRDDGVGLRHVFDTLVPPPSHSELVAAGHLVPARVLGPSAKSKQLAEDPVRALLEHARDRRTIVFASSIRAGKDLVTRYDAMGIRSAWVDGTTKDAVRALAIEKYRSGQLQVLVNFLLFTEGFDAPETSCVILGRNMSSAVAYLQATGRGLRCAPGKRDCLVLDLCGTSHEHGLPDEPRTYSLDGRAISTAVDSEPVRQCPQCFRMFRSSLFVDAQCPGCGYLLPKKLDPAIRRQILGEINASHPDVRRTEKLRELLRIAQSKGYKLGWALTQFKIRYSHWPDEGIKRNAGFYEAQASVRRTGT